MSSQLKLFFMFHFVQVSLFSKKKKKITKVGGMMGNLQPRKMLELYSRQDTL